MSVNFFTMQNSELQVVKKSNKGKPLIELNGFTYLIDKKHNDSIYWICSKKHNQTLKCKSRMVSTSLQENKCVILKECNNHNHNAATTSELVKMDVNERVRKAVISSKYLKASTIINSLHSSLQGSTDLSCKHNLKCKINYQKRKLYPNQPANINDINEDAVKVITSSGENFLLHLSSDHQILMFGTVNNLEMLCKSSQWMADGTFKVVPSMYEQLFTVFGLIHDIYYPLIFVLLSDERQETYQKMLEILLELCAQNNIEQPSSFVVHLDYEIASNNAFKIVFPKCNISRCLFHLAQSTNRRVSTSGLRQLYINNAEFRENIKLLPALSFLPSSEIPEAYDILKENVCSDAKPIYKYFEANYIKGSVKYTTRSGIEVRNHPLFPPEEWSSYENTLQGIQRSNNMQEGWHNRLSITCPKSHPCLGQFLETMLNEHANVVHNMKKHLENALIPPKRKKKDIVRDKHISLLVNKYKYGIINQMELLMGLVGNFDIDE